jgi:hypothetical protein
VNPFTHFLEFGSLENRAPYSGFPTEGNGFTASTYAANNPDLATAGITTDAALYQHFVAFGQFESRPGTPTVPVKEGESGSATPGATFTLTTDPDNFSPNQANTSNQTTDGDDTFRGDVAVNVLQTADTIDAGGGTDTLNVDLKDSADQKPVLQNLELIFASDDTGSSTSSIDLGDSSGVTQAWIKDSGAGGSTFEYKGVSTSTTVGLSGAIADDATFTFSSVGGSSDTATLALEEAVVTTGKDVTIAGIETLNISLIDKASTSGTSLSDIDTISVAATKTINVSGTADFTIGNAAGSDFTALEKFDASGMTGDLILDLNTGTSPTVGTTVLVSAGGTNTLTLSAGGQDDVLEWTSANVSTLNKLTTVGGFVQASEDKVDLKAFSLGADTTVGATVLSPAGDTAGFFTGTERVILNDATDTVYVDIDKDGTFDAATDLAFVLTGVTAAGFTASDLILA